ncbi:MAG: hypothetical protein GEV11_29750 [Streptosporangiales bacterium]|nr:hypothetical protein [Streptosporangiales bacterium]
MAIAALVLGICGLVTFGYTGLMAVPLAIAALVAISRAHQRGISMGGKGMAIKLKDVYGLGT